MEMAVPQLQDVALGWGSPDGAVVRALMSRGDPSFAVLLASLARDVHWWLGIAGFDNGKEPPH